MTRKPKVQSPSEIARQKKLNRDRVQKCGLLQKAKQKAGVNGEVANVVYKTPQALGKAVGKVKAHLPKSPRKRKAVIVKLASSSGLEVLTKKKKKFPAGNSCLSPEVTKKVKSFYLRDSISRQSPRKKDFVVSWQNGKKEHLQKRHLMFSLKKVHALFLKDNPKVQIGLSKFSSLPPINVLLSSEMPRNVFMCQYHENIKLICDCLSKKLSEFPSYSGDFLDNFVCSSESEECMLGKRINCPNWLDTIVERTALQNPAIWYEWERIETVVLTCSRKKSSEGKKVIKRMKKIWKEGTISNVVESLQQKLPTFLEHVYIKTQQSKYFDEKLANLSEKEAVVQVDFAENYTCKHQDEIQTAHWNQEQVTIFTVAVWIKSSADGEKVCESHAIVSDETTHDKKAVAVFMFQVFEKFIKEKHSDIKQVYVFSDGPSSQFKNKYIANFIHILNKIGPIQWNYFATSHGKGVVDGIGGTIKRMVWNAVMSRKAAVVDAQSFVEVASGISRSVNISLVDKKEIQYISDSIGLEKCFSKAKPLPGISRFHCMEPQGNESVNCCLYSLQLLDTNRPPGVYLFNDSDVDDSDSESFWKESCDEENDNSSDAEFVSEDESESEIKVIKEVRTGYPPHSSTKESPNANVKQGIPDELYSLFEKTPTCLPQYISTQIQAILKGQITFCGSNLIAMADMQSLVGNLDTKDK